jgi:hypothetical protein
MRRYITFSFLTVTVLGFLKIFSIVPFVRMAADDFSYTITVVNRGFIDTQLIWYKSWTGRFAATLMQSLFGYLSRQSGVTSFYTAITFIALFLGFYLVVKYLLKRNHNVLLTLIFAGISLVTFYYLTPNKNESWYWLSGSATYLWPLIFSLYSLALIIRGKLDMYGHLVIASTFLAVGANETVGFLITLLLSILFLYKVFVKKEAKTSEAKLVLVAFISSALSFLLVFFSPGNDIRIEGVASDKMNWLGSVFYSIQEGPKILFEVLRNKAIFLISLFFVFSYYFSASIKSDEENRLVNTFATLTAPLLISVFYALPGFRALGRVSPDRSHILLAFVVVLALIFSSYYFSYFIRSFKKSAFFKIFILLSAFIFLASSFQLVSNLGSDLYTARNYSVQFDDMFAKLKGAKGGVVEIDELPESGLVHPAQIKGYKDHWINYAVADFFGLEAVIAK